jgi:hypothetical protein
MMRVFSKRDSMNYFTEDAPTPEEDMRRHLVAEREIFEDISRLMDEGDYEAARFHEDCFLKRLMKSKAEVAKRLRASSNMP